MRKEKLKEVVFSNGSGYQWYGDEKEREESRKVFEEVCKENGIEIPSNVSTIYTEY